MIKTADFDYHLPKELISQKPIFPRDQCRLMVIDRQSGAIKHRRFFEIADFLQKGDVLVLNNTKVFKARLVGRIRNKESGMKIEIFLLKPLMSLKSLKALKTLKSSEWETLAKPGRKLRIGSRIEFAKNFWCEVKTKKPDGRFLVRFNQSAARVVALADRYGHIPVPPYIKTEPAKLADYQTIYAKQLGSVAAPTAGFHFTRALLDKLRRKGVEIYYLTLHVGYGTFKPIKTERIEDHQMEPEWVEIPKSTAEAINRAKEEGRRVVAVGTTVARALEGAVRNPNFKILNPKQIQNPKFKMTRSVILSEAKDLLFFTGEVNLFIYPGFKFRVVDALITNFHLPKSTLILLVSAFAGRDLIMKAYREAIKKKYRFYSFGNAMVIL